MDIQQVTTQKSLQTTHPHFFFFFKSEKRMQKIKKGEENPSATDVPLEK